MPLDFEVISSLAGGELGGDESGGKVLPFEVIPHEDAANGVVESLFVDGERRAVGRLVDD